MDRNGRRSSRKSWCMRAASNSQLLPGYATSAGTTVAIITASKPAMSDSTHAATSVSRRASALSSARSGRPASRRVAPHARVAGARLSTRTMAPPPLHQRERECRPMTQLAVEALPTHDEEREQDNERQARGYHDRPPTNRKGTLSTQHPRTTISMASLTPESDRPVGSAWSVRRGHDLDGPVAVSPAHRDGASRRG